MSIETFIYCLVIFCAAATMFVSMMKARSILQVAPLIPERHRKKICRHLNLHRALMGFFLCGYLVVLLAFAFKIPLVSQLFVSIIFLLGAVFVLMGISIQARLLSEIQSTLRGLLPICSKCKKIRIQDGEVKDPESWKNIEVYISKKSDVDFSHGLCPDCFNAEMIAIKRLKKKAKQAH
jgi:prepilin signal peptidase PulO-like enzyme (type II secretory pathway)